MNRRTLLLTSTTIIALLVVAGLLFITGLSTQAAGQATYVVDDDGDSGNGNCGDSQCTLRDAILEANDSAGIDTITFDLPANTTITLNGTQLPTITENLVIEGTGIDNLTISAANASRLLSVDAAVVRTVQDITLRDASNIGGNGGAIYNQGTVNLQNTWVTSNTADYGAAVFNQGGSLTVVGSEITENIAEYFGGVVDNENSGTVTIASSTIASNTAYSNGGVFFQIDGSVTVVSSTISNNYGSIGGAFYTGGGALIVRNSTIFSNTALTWGGGFYIESTSAVTINNSTISHNSANTDSGGGLYSYQTDPQLNLTNVIIANSDDGGDCFAENASLIINLNNLVEDGGCSAAYSGDPLLLNLGDYGGDTLTMLPLLGSPAIDQGDNASCETTDQRGVNRPLDGDKDNVSTCDIGAVEVPPPTLIVTTVDDTDDGICDTDCSLREAINASNIIAGLDEITFDLPDSSNITLGGSQLPVISDSLTINGSTAVSLTINGTNSSRIFEINNGQSVTLTTMTLTGGDVSGGLVYPVNYGGAILNQGQLTATHVIFEANDAERGGAIYNDSGSDLRMLDNDFINNAATWGGAIYHGSGGEMIAANSEFTENNASSGAVGGAIYLSSGTSKILSSRFYSNTAGWGGGVANYGSNMTVSNSTFSYNAAVYDGGGIYNTSGEATLNTNIVSYNQAGWGGGILNESGGTISSSDNTLINNNATVRGGALYNGGNWTGHNETARYNDAVFYGGGFYIADTGVMTITATTLQQNSAGTGGGLGNFGQANLANNDISDNVANSGGGIFNADKGIVYGLNNDIASNEANATGGGISNLGYLALSSGTVSENSADIAGGIDNEPTGYLELVDMIIYKNVTDPATGYGGGLYNYGKADVTRSTIVSNTTAIYGGGIYVLSGGQLTMTNSTVSFNTAGWGGGLANSSIARVNNSTFNENSAGNGAGVRNNSSGHLYLSNTIVANGLLGDDCVNDGVIESNIHNLVEDNKNCSPFQSGDPKLGSLAYNGGETFSHAITLDSANAYNQGDNATCEATDQRGVARPQDGTCDIGSYELMGNYLIFLPMVIK